MVECALCAYEGAYLTRDNALLTCTRQYAVVVRGRCAMLDMKTDESFLERLRKSAESPLSPEELQIQRVSFVYGNLPIESSITKQKVNERLSHFVIQKG